MQGSLLGLDADDREESQEPFSLELRFNQATCNLHEITVVGLKKTGIEGVRFCARLKHCAAATGVLNPLAK
jgi:hypothetical protein